MIHAKLSKLRYDNSIIAGPNSSERRIVVIMDVPDNVDDWIKLADEGTLLSNNYWMTCEGLPERNEETITISAPVEHVFDDAALCEIMEKVKGGMPL